MRYLLVLLLTINVGCAASEMDKARTIVGVSSDITRSISTVIAPHAERALQEAETNPEAARRFNLTLEAIAHLRSTILAAEVILDAIDAGAAHDISQVIGCITSAVMRLVAILPELDVDVPEELTMLLTLLSNFAGGCSPQDVPAETVAALRELVAS